MQNIIFPESFLIRALTVSPCHILLLRLLLLSPIWPLFLSQYSLCVYGCAWSLVRCLPSLRPQCSCCSWPSSLCNDSSAAVGKGDFILGIFHSADPSHPSQTAVPGACSHFQSPLAAGLHAVWDLRTVICISPGLGVSLLPVHIVHMLCHRPRMAGMRQDANPGDLLVSLVPSCRLLCESTRLWGPGQQGWSRPRVCCPCTCTKRLNKTSDKKVGESVPPLYCTGLGSLNPTGCTAALVLEELGLTVGPRWHEVLLSKSGF